MHKDYFQLNLHSKCTCVHYTTRVMRVSLRPLLRIRLVFRVVGVRVLAYLIKSVLRVKSTQLQLSYASNFVHDGLGAQIQRQLSIEALANFLGVVHISKPLEHIAIHPLDPFQSIIEMQDFLAAVNSEFRFGKNHALELPITHRKKKLNIYGLFVLVLGLFIKRDTRHLSVCEVYDIVDCIPNIYSENIAPIRFPIKSEKNFPKHNFICIHFRQGVGGKVIYPGQKLPRELDLGYFTKTLSRCDYEGKQILVLTDAPLAPTTYKPVTDQRHLWEGTPKFENGTMSISGFDLTKGFRAEGFDVQVISGGNPLDALKLMIQCDTLIMSRSSLSYSAAILNKKATIFYPPEFWHPAMRDWKK